MHKKNSTTRLFFFFTKLVIAMIAFALVLLLAIPIGFYGMAMYLAPTLPSVQEIKTASLEMPLQIYSYDNKLIGQYGNRISLPVTYEEVPKDLINAFLAAEDSSFFEHSGISVRGLGRAITEAINEDESQTGGSTITMQMAKNYFLSSERTLHRKLIQIFLARKIEDELTKDEIFTLYINKIYLGEGAYGIKAAAKKYYSKSLNNLTIAEMAMLAGLPKAPSTYNPVANPQQALKRRNWIIGRMLSLGYITQAQYDEAIKAPIGLNVYQEKLDVNMPYLAEMARSRLVSRYGEQVISSGWRVRLTVDSKVQAAAETAVKKGLTAYDHRHGWRGVEAHDEPLENFHRYDNMYPAKVTKVLSNSFQAQLQSGETITVNWSGIRWARKYYSANRVGGGYGRASQIVKVGDIVRVIPNSNKTSWQLTQIPKVQGSLVAINPENGALEALVGGFDFNHSKFNRATQGFRQPGSTIKPLIYTAALEKGYTPDSMVSDSPLQIGKWRPKNADGRFYGDMPLRRGLYLSRNLVSIRLLLSVGIPQAHQLLTQFGLDKEKLPPTPSLALGTAEATPLQMATAYATFANGGHRVQPYFIEQIYSFNNNLIYQANPAQACAECFNDDVEKLNEKLRKEHEKTIKNNDKAEKPTDKTKTKAKGNKEKNKAEDINEDNVVVLDGSPANDRLKNPLIQYGIAPQAPRIISAKSAYNMAGILKDVIQRGTATKARALGRSDIGGKTGTTNDAKDAWFAGFHPSIVTVVWIGFDQPSTLGRREYGGVAALPVWMDFMRSQLANTPHQWVSDKNISKTKKQQQQIVALTDDGEVVLQDDNNKADESKIKTKPTKPTARRRPAPPPEPINAHDDLPAPATNLTNTNNQKEHKLETINAQPIDLHINNQPKKQDNHRSRVNRSNQNIGTGKPLNAIAVDELPPMPSE